MNLKKILLYIEPRTNVELISQFTVNLTRQNDARLFALSIISRPEPSRKTRLEEEAWKRLYEVEEDAFESGIKISLLLEEIENMGRNALTQKLMTLASMFEADILIVQSNAKLNFKSLTGDATIPVIVVPPRQSV
jgi:hypothetical protein